EALAQQADLVDDPRRGPNVVGVAVDRFRAPVTQIRAAPRGDDVERKVAVPAQPERAIARDVDEVPGRKRQLIQLFEQRARSGATLDAAIGEDQPGNIVVADGGAEVSVGGWCGDGG